MLAEYLFKLKNGEEIILNRRDGMSFLNHLIEFEKDLIINIVSEYGHKMKFKKIN